MDIHKNARLTRRARERLAKIVLSGQMPQAASKAAGGGARQSICASALRLSWSSQRTTAQTTVRRP
jgi:hypothetical protein